MKISTIILSALISFIVAYGTVQFVAPGTARPEQKTETTFERIQRTRTIRCGYMLIPSLLRRDENTKKLSGISYDMMTVMANNLKVKLEWTAEAGFASVAEDLKNNRFDMLCIPMSTNAARGQVMDVSRKLFFMPFYLWIAADSTHDKQDISWINQPGTTLASVDGTVFNSLYSYYFPQAKVTALPELTPLSEMLLQVSMKKADATLMPLFDAQVFIKNNPNSLKQGSAEPVFLSSYSFWMPKGDVKLKGMLDTAMTEMIENGTIDRILSAHEPSPGQYYWRIAKEYQTPSHAE